MSSNILPYPPGQDPTDPMRNGNRGPGGPGQQQLGDKGLWEKLLGLLQSQGMAGDDALKLAMSLGQGGNSAAGGMMSAQFGNGGGSMNVNVGKLLPLMSSMMKKPAPQYSADTVSRNSLPSAGSIFNA